MTAAIELSRFHACCLIESAREMCADAIEIDIFYQLSRWRLRRLAQVQWPAYIRRKLSYQPRRVSSNLPQNIHLVSSFHDNTSVSSASPEPTAEAHFTKGSLTSTCLCALCTLDGTHSPRACASIYVQAHSIHRRMLAHVLLWACDCTCVPCQHGRAERISVFTPIHKWFYIDNARNEFIYVFRCCCHLNQLRTAIVPMFFAPNIRCVVFCRINVCPMYIRRAVRSARVLISIFWKMCIYRCWGSDTFSVSLEPLSRTHGARINIFRSTSALTHSHTHSHRVTLRIRTRTLIEPIDYLRIRTTKNLLFGQSRFTCGIEHDKCVAVVDKQKQNAKPHRNIAANNNKRNQLAKQRPFIRRLKRLTSWKRSRAHRRTKIIKFIVAGKQKKNPRIEKSHVHCRRRNSMAK